MTDPNVQTPTQGDTGAGPQGGQAGDSTTPQQTTQTPSQEQTPAAGDQPQGQTPAGDKPGDTDKGQTQQGQQEHEYTWTPPSDLKVKLDDKAVEGFKTFAKAQGLTPEQFQASLELYSRQTAESFKAFEAANQANVEALAKEWGGDYDKNIGVAKKGLEAFADKDTLKVLEQTGAAFHPSVVKMFHSIGMRLSEDKAKGQGNPGSAGAKTLADTLYPPK